MTQSLLGHEEIEEENLSLANRVLVLCCLYLLLHTVVFSFLGEGISDLFSDLPPYPVANQLYCFCLRYIVAVCC